MKIELTPDASVLQIRSVAYAALNSYPACESLHRKSMAKMMKAGLLVLFVASLLHALSAQRAEAGVIPEPVIVTMVEDATLDSDPYTQQVTISAASPRKGILEESQMSIGTIINSYHFSSYDFNETHGGLYIRMNQWTVGTFLNSVEEQSVMVTYNSNLYKKESFKIDLVAGVVYGD